MNIAIDAFMHENNVRMMYAVIVGLGILNLVLLVLSVMRYRTSEHRGCSACQYSMANLEVLRCPECGVLFRTLGIPGKGLVRGFSTRMLAMVSMVLSCLLVSLLILPIAYALDHVLPPVLVVEEKISVFECSPRITPGGFLTSNSEVTEGRVLDGAWHQIWVIDERIYPSQESLQRDTPDSWAHFSDYIPYYPDLSSHGSTIMVFVEGTSPTSMIDILYPETTPWPESSTDLPLGTFATPVFPGQVGDVLVIPGNPAPSVEIVEGWLRGLGIAWRVRKQTSLDEIFLDMSSVLLGLDAQASTTLPVLHAVEESEFRSDRPYIKRASWITNVCSIGILFLLCAPVWSMYWWARRRKQRLSS